MTGLRSVMMIGLLLVMGVLTVTAAVTQKKGLAMVAGVPTYTFPDRWQSLSFGWVADCFSSHKHVYVTGFLFTDYFVNKQRVDEVWNISSIAGTGIAQWGIIADTHIFSASGEPSWYYFLNNSGPQCTTSVSGFMAQDTFADPSAYAGNVTVDGRLLYHFALPLPVPLQKESVELFVDPQLNAPVKLVAPKVPPMFQGSVVYYEDFQVVDQPWPDPTMFTAPSYCVPGPFAVPPGCGLKPSLRS